MKLYVVVYTEYFESDGIENEVLLYENREEAVQELENNYNKKNKTTLLYLWSCFLYLNSADGR